MHLLEYNISMIPDSSEENGGSSDFYDFVIFKHFNKLKSVQIGRMHTFEDAKEIIEVTVNNVLEPLYQFMNISDKNQIKDFLPIVKYDKNKEESYHLAWKYDGEWCLVVEENM